MLSHTIKKLLDGATGLDFKPLNAVLPLPCGSYTLREIDRGPINLTQCNVRVFVAQYDQAETYREKIIELLDTAYNAPGIDTDSYFIRGSLSGGGVLEEPTSAHYELSLIFILKWKRKDK